MRIAKVPFARFVFYVAWWAVVVQLARPTPACVYGGERLSAPIRAVTEEARFKHAHWGLLVADRATGEVLEELDADKFFAPASTTKLYSVASKAAAIALRPPSIAAGPSMLTESWRGI